MFRRAIASVAVSILIVNSAPVLAADFFESRGGWDIGSTGDSCGMSMEFEGPGDTVVVFMKEADGDVFLHVTNMNWSAKEGQEYDVRYLLNGKAYGGTGSLGITSSIRKGFMAKFENDFEQAFAAGDTLHVYLSEQKIDELSLAGTGAALASLNRCLSRVRARVAAEAREKARWEHLPKDPFAGGAGLVPKQPPAPLGSPGSWATANDYPSAALREGRQGSTSLRLTVGVDGRVIDCQVTASSGHVDLDEAACANITRRARFTPATDGTGKPAVGTYDQTVRWTPPYSGSASDIAAPLRAAQAARSAPDAGDEQFRRLMNGWQAAGDR